MCIWIVIIIKIAKTRNSLQIYRHNIYFLFKTSFKLRIPTWTPLTNVLKNPPHVSHSTIPFRLQCSGSPSGFWVFIDVNKVFLF